MDNFNLIVSCRRFGEADAEEEALDLLDQFGDGEAISEVTNVTGLIVCRTILDPYGITRKLSSLVKEEPWSVRYLLRVLPIDIVVRAGIQEIAEAAAGLGSARIAKKDTFRITVEKRHSTLESKEIINSVASRIQNTVDLEHPDWTVLIEIIGGQAGISVLRPGEIFSAVKEKRG